MRRVEPRARILIAVIVAWAVILAVFGATKARGDGLPVPGGVDTTHAGVLSADGTQRYLAVPQGGRTLVERIDARNGVMQASRAIEGVYVVPGVSVDGDTAGLSADESALVLLRPRSTFPQRTVSLLVLDPRTLAVRRHIGLKGDFSFDAISPDGRMAYLVEYPNPRDPTDYRLRRLRLADGRLLPGSLLPANEPEEEMRGFPTSRTTGLGGRWEYTLYDGGATYGRGEPGEPFVHALDTVDARTLCIDLGWLRPGALNRIDLRMSGDGSEVEVVDPLEGVVGRIDASTGEARQVSEPFGETTTEAGEGGGIGGDLGGIAVAVGCIGGGLALLRLLLRRRRSGTSAASGEAV